MDNRILDVAIGLVLVLALSSLIASVLAGFVGNWQQTRGSNLLAAVASMLGDDAQLAGKLYELPLVRTLYLKGGKPSYMEPDIFLSALFELLAKEATLPVQRGQGTPQGYVSALLAKITPTAGNAATATGLAAVGETLQSLCAGVENDWPAFEARVRQWFVATTDRSIGWFTRKTQALLFGVGLALAVVLNINPIVISIALWNDPVLRTATVAAAQQAVAEREATVRAAAVPAAAPAASDQQQKAVSALASAQKLTNDDIDQLIKILNASSGSQATALIMQASTLRQEVLRARNIEAMPNPHSALLAEAQKSIDAGLVKLQQDFAGASVSASKPFLATLELAQAQAKRIDLAIANERHVAMPAPPSAPPAADSPSGFAVCPSVPGLGTLQNLESNGQAAGEGDAKALSQGQTAGEGDAKARARGQAALGQLCALGIPLGWNGRQWLPPVFGSDGTAAHTLGNFAAMVLGFLITAVACTLGAQFWFDLLGQLVKLRGTKPNEADASGKAGTTGAATSPPSGAGAQAPPGASSPFQNALNEAERALSEQQTRDIQKALKMPSSKLSGVLDADSREEIIAWHARTGRGGSNELTSQDIATLLSSVPSAQPAAGDGSGPALVDDDDACGCDVAVDAAAAMDDDQLPAARGGVV